MGHEGARALHFPILQGTGGTGCMRIGENLPISVGWYDTRLRLKLVNFLLTHKQLQLHQ